MAITDRVIAYYSGGSTADELGVNTLTANGTSPGYVTGKVGDAFDCDNTNGVFWSRANASCGDFQMGLKSQSRSFWVYINALPANSAQLVSFGGNWQSGLDPGFGVHLESTGKLLYRFSDGSTWAGSTGSTTLATSTWYHVAQVCDRNGFMRGYVNGVQDGSISISTYSATSLTTTRDFEIGGNFGSGVNFDGLIDELLIYDGVMSGDIRAIHRNGTTGISYADFAAITRPFVSQEFIHEQETNTTNATTVVDGLAAGQIAVAYLSTDGIITSPAIADWETPWTAAGNAQSSTAVGLRIWSRTVTSTDASTETQVAATWTSNEKAVFIVQIWENCAGIDVASVTTSGAAGTSHSAANVDSTVGGGHVVTGISIDGGSTVTATNYSGLVQNEYQVTNAAGHTGLWIGSYNYPQVGAVGANAFTISGSVNACQFVLVMEPNTEVIEFPDQYIDAANAYRWTTTAKASKLAGSGAQDGLAWLVTTFPAEMIDTDETATVLAAGAPTLRAALNPDGTGQIAVDVQDFTPAAGGHGSGATARVWLNPGAYTAGADFDVTFFWVAGGDMIHPHPSSEYGSAVVYTDYGAAWEFDEDPSGAAPQMRDKTANNNHGTSQGTMTSGDLVDLIEGTGIDFDGSNDAIAIPDNDTLSFSPSNGLSFGLWFNSVTQASFRTFMSKRDNTLTPDAEYYMNKDESGNVEGGFYDGAFNGTSAAWSGNFTNGDLYFLVTTVEQSGADVVVRLYKNGAQLSTTTYTSTTPSNNTAPVTIGATKYSTASVDEEINAQITFPFVYQGVMTADQLLTLYRNISDAADFWDATAAVEPAAGGGDTNEGQATLSDEIGGYVTGAKTGIGYATMSDDIGGYAQTLKVGAGSATMSDGFVSYTVYAKIGAATVTLSDEITGWSSSGSIRSGVVTLSDEVVGYVIGGTNVIPSQIALSIAHLHKIGLTLSNINKITLTIDRI